MSKLYDFQLVGIDGTERSLAELEGRAVLIVNVASQCGLTPQYAGLQALHEEYGPRGLTVMGVPCNQFGAQEPGTEADIKDFCESRYSVTFPMYSKVEVNGSGRHPLYGWLTEVETEPDGPGDIAWNFAKFLVDRDGHVVARFEPATAPTDAKVREAIEQVL
jgi:glutathione peroxidase